MRKTLKKAMSVVLSAALVLSLGNVGFSKEASAADGDLTWEGSVEMGMGADWAMSAITVNETASNGITLAGDDSNNFQIDMTADLSAFTNPYITVTATAAAEEGLSFAVCGVDWSPVYVGINNATEDNCIPADQTTIEGYLDPAVSDYAITAQGRTLTSIVITEGEGSAAAAAEEVVYFQWDGTWVPSYWTEADGTVTGSAEGEVTTGTVDASVSDDKYGMDVYDMDLSTLADPTLTITYTGDVNLTDGTGDFSVQDADYKNLDLSGATDANGVFTMALDASLTTLHIYPSTAGITVTQIKISGAAASTADDAAAAEDTDDDVWFTMELWANGDFDWDEIPRDTVNVTGPGEYTLAFTSICDLEDINANSGAVWVQSTLTEEPTDFDVVGKTITVGGTEYDWSDVIFYQDGDYYRLSVMNTWGDEKANPFADTVIPVAVGDEISVTFEVVGGDSGEVTGATYHGYLGFQTAVWNYRNQWACKESMESSVDGYDFDTMAIFGGAATDPSQVVIQNATITENGEYTVSMTGLDLSEDQYFNMLYVSTDIPSTMSGVEVTDAVITLDDKTYEMAVLPVKNDIRNGNTDGDYAGYMFMAIDYYDKTNEDLNNDIITDWDDGVPENFTMPQNTISISFKISGVDFAFSDNAGAKKTVNGVTYKVTKNGNAKVVKVKNQKKVTIKNKVKINGTSYKVTSLKKGVFSGKSKVANVTLGKNIKKIPAKAFKKCTSLKKLTVNAKLTSVKKNAFKGCKKTIKVSGKKVAANVKTLKASGYKKFTK